MLANQLAVLDISLVDRHLAELRLPNAADIPLLAAAACSVPCAASIVPYQLY